MSELRAAKSGFAAEAQKKVFGKWQNDRAVEAMNWISKSLGLPLPDGYNGGMDETHTFLKDGMVLLKLAHWVKPGHCKTKIPVKPPTFPFKQMELIAAFLEFLKKEELVSDTECFQTVDLYENGNMPTVITTIEALGRKLQNQNRGFGKAESVGEKKEWTEEQLKAGQNIIGLQMGTNQGANQSGLNMGKTRAIMD